jgi:hypothetical protein
MEPGILSYRIIVSNGSDVATFPGNFKGDPWSWDNYTYETWKINVAAPDSDVEIYNANRNQFIWSEPSWDSNIETAYRSSGTPYQLIYSVLAKKTPKNNVAGFQTFIGDRIEARSTELKNLSSLVLRVKGIGEPNLKISLINSDGLAYSSTVTSSQALADIEIPLASFKADSMLLLPRPYPGFQKLTFSSGSASNLDLRDIEKLEITMGAAGGDARLGGCGFAIESVRLKNTSK